MNKLILIFLICFSSIQFGQSYQTYVIKAGKHECEQSRVQFVSPNQKIQFKFTESCLYNENSVVSGWNKLWGFASINNHQNSIRIGWRQHNDSIVLSSYAYVNSVRIIVPIDTIQINQTVNADIYWSNGNYVVKVNNITILTPQPNKPNFFTFQQYPYFGGESVQPHVMIFLIRKR